MGGQGPGLGGENPPIPPLYDNPDQILGGKIDDILKINQAIDIFKLTSTLLSPTVQLHLWPVYNLQCFAQVMLPFPLGPQ